jgi:hypothetical protein
MECVEKVIDYVLDVISGIYVSLLFLDHNYVNVTMNQEFNATIMLGCVECRSQICYLRKHIQKSSKAFYSSKVSTFCVDRELSRPTLMLAMKTKGVGRWAGQKI